MYNIYSGHTFKNDDDHYKVVSCDPAIRNFAIRIEKREKKDDTYAGKISLILSEKIDIKDIKKTKDTPGRTRYELLYDFLDKFREHFLTTHIFIVERQMTRNFEACKISQHILSYFLSLRHEMKTKCIIIDVSAKNKGKMMGVPPKCTDYWLKQWSVLRAAELFKCRGDECSYKLLESYSKKDDIADTAIQIEAAFRMLKLPLTENFDHDGGPKDLETIKNTRKPGKKLKS